MKEDLSVQRALIKKYIFWIVAIPLVIFSLIIIKSYIIAIISAFILAYLIQPIYKKLSMGRRSKTAALLCVLLVALIILLPVIIIANTIIQQASSIANIQDNIEPFKKLLSSTPFKDIDFSTLKEKGLSFLIASLTATIKQIPNLIINIAVALFALYYMLLYSENIKKEMENYIPFRDKKRIAEEISLITKNIMYGYVLIAIIEFIIALIGFWISGVEYALIFALLIALLAFVPALGPFLVWAPLSLFYLLTQNYNMAIGVLITGIVISVFIDTFIAAKIIEKKTKINPLIFLLGVLGGIPIFGIFGFIIGPLILIYTAKLLKEIMIQD